MLCRHYAFADQIDKVGDAQPTDPRFRTEYTKDDADSANLTDLRLVMLVDNLPELAKLSLCKDWNEAVNNALTSPTVQTLSRLTSLRELNIGTASTM